MYTLSPVGVVGRLLVTTSSLWLLPSLMFVALYVINDIISVHNNIIYTVLRVIKAPIM